MLMSCSWPTAVQMQHEATFSFFWSRIANDYDYRLIVKIIGRLIDTIFINTLSNSFICKNQFLKKYILHLFHGLVCDLDYVFSVSCTKKAEKWTWKILLLWLFNPLCRHVTRQLYLGSRETTTLIRHWFAEMWRMKDVHHLGTPSVTAFTLTVLFARHRELQGATKLKGWTTDHRVAHSLLSSQLDLLQRCERDHLSQVWVRPRTTESRVIGILLNNTWLRDAPVFGQRNLPADFCRLLHKKTDLRLFLC